MDALSYSEGRQPRSVELFASINAVSLKSIEQGDFELVVSPLVATQQAGASWGRFASMLGAVDDFTEITGHADTEEGHPLPVQLSYSTHHERGANIAAVPHLSDNKLTLGAYDEQHAPGRRIRVEDIMVSADPAGFYLHDLASGMEINPFVPHVLNGSLAPNIAKFLRDALTLGIRPLGKWDWGSLDRLPFLPAIKYGRTRLSPAKWILRSVDLVEDDWDASFDDWRRQWNVPDRIKIGHTDQLGSLDLRIASHRIGGCSERVCQAMCVPFTNPDLPKAPTGGWWVLGVHMKPRSLCRSTQNCRKGSLLGSRLLAVRARMTCTTRQVAGGYRYICTALFRPPRRFCSTAYHSS